MSTTRYRVGDTRSVKILWRCTAATDPIQSSEREEQYGQISRRSPQRSFDTMTDCIFAALLCWLRNMSYNCNHLPNNLWHCISGEQWMHAEDVMRSEKGQANSIGRVFGINRGTHRWTDDFYGQTGNDGEYPLSTVLRMKAPDSLILAMPKVYGNAASVKDNDGLLPVDLHVNGEYSDLHLTIMLSLFSWQNFMRDWLLWWQRREINAYYPQRTKAEAHSCTLSYRAAIP